MTHPSSLDGVRPSASDTVAPTVGCGAVSDPELNVAAEYGMILLKDAPASADGFARFVLGDGGQAMLAKHGFGPGDPVK